MRFFACALLLALGLPGLARAGVAEDFAQAVAYYERGEYQEAIVRFDGLLNPIRLTHRDEVLRAYELLGASYFSIDDKAAAREMFVRLLSMDPDHVLDPIRFPPPLVGFFAGIKDEIKDQLEAIRAMERKKAELLTQERKRREEAAKIYIVRERDHHSLVVALLPFGAGQFQNREPLKGWLIGGTQIAGLAMNAGAFWYASALRNDRGYYNDVAGAGDELSDVDRAGRARIVQYVGLGVFGLSYALGLADALTRYEPVVTRESRLEGSPDAVAAPGAGAVAPEPDVGPLVEVEKAASAAPLSAP